MFQYSEPIGKTAGKEVISTVLEFAEDKEFDHFESATYESASLLADIGGAAGLFLGLSVVVTDFVIVGKQSLLQISSILRLYDTKSVIRHYRKDRVDWTAVLQSNSKNFPDTNTYVIIDST